MSLAIRVLMTVGLVACLTSVAHALKGIATFDTPPYVPSTCFRDQDKGYMIVSVNSKLYDSGSACGQVYRVRCTGPKDAGCTASIINVTVVGLCSICNNDEIELSEEAFEQIATKVGIGRINIEYARVYTATEFEEEFEDAKCKNKLVIESI